MAPILNIIIKLLPTLPTTSKLRSHIEPVQPSQHQVVHQQQQLYSSDSNLHATKDTKSTISAISWGPDRLDVFGLQENNVSHKYWDGHQWNPTNAGLETLGNGLATPPVAVTWGVDRLDIFGLDDHNTIKHQYWTGVEWRPAFHELENLGGACDGNSSIAANSWGPDRLDIFCTSKEGELLHQYYNGQEWRPSHFSLETLQGSLAGPPSVISWGENRLDIFAVTKDAEVAHLYWDGHQWNGWEVFTFAEHPFRKDIPLSVTSWGENRLDIYGVGQNNALYHKYWDGYQWAAWEYLGNMTGIESVAATSWSANRIDIVIKVKGKLYYKYYNGAEWKPMLKTFYPKSPYVTFRSDPSVVSWGENRFDIFGVSVNGDLVHQTWTGESWYPSETAWEYLTGSAPLAEVDVASGSDMEL
ncbi:MAG: hypothetical protein LQ339_000786 [Xanthoria mediterranea]|nr:MAG: hypothetical protein LQ339_000786 [Xanthoria mediterranea]